MDRNYSSRFKSIKIIYLSFIIYVVNNEKRINIFVWCKLIWIISSLQIEIDNIVSSLSCELSPKFSHLFHFYFVISSFIDRLCATLFVFLLSFKYLFDSDCPINFDPVQIKSMTLSSSTL